MRVRFILALIPFGVGCASTHEANKAESLPVLPTTEEISRFVASNWPAESRLFAFRAGRAEQKATLVSVTDVSCQYTFTSLDCDYLVTGRFEDTTTAQARLSSNFVRDADGNLQSAIVFWHFRRR